MKQRLTYGNVMATVAMFIALGGTSYAAATISGKDVKNGSLTGKDVKNRSLTGTDVKNRSLKSADIKDEALTGSDVKDGSLSGTDLAAGTIKTTRWLLLNEAGDIEEQSGGFTVVSKPGINGQPAGNPNVYVDAGESLVGKGLAATIAIQNKLDRDTNGTPDPAFAGDAAVGRCNTGAIMCVPNGTNVDNVLVVRALADNGTPTSQTRRVYVQVTP
ncbi:MAG TPA: hypothetical protein VF533_12530 [Solirubrobacteraceae bacterium]|jgi:hypothetical protein